jgi:hypothetical protein
MLATAALTLALALPQPAANDGKPVCPWYQDSTVEALYRSLTHVDITCQSHAVGYVEGVFDAGVGTLFKAPEKPTTLTELRMFFLVACQDDVLRRDAFGAAGLAYVFRSKFGEVEDEDVHER